MTRQVAIGLLSLLALIVTAVAPTAVVAQQGRDIEDGEWQLVTVRDETGQSVPTPPGIGITLVLFGEAFGSGPCSNYAADYSLAGKVLQFFEPTVDARDCDDAARRVEEAFFAALRDTGSFAISGAALTLDDIAGDEIATFTLAQVPPDPTISPWRLQRIARPDGTSGPVVEGSQPSFTFLRGGRVIGDSGCGTFLGSWQANNELIRISDVASRQENCTSALAEQAETIIATLDDVTDFTIRPAGLSLEDTNDTARLALVPAIPLKERNWSPFEVFDEDGEQVLDRSTLRTASVFFDRNRVSGRTNCFRDYDGSTQQSGLALAVFGIDVEQVSCRRKRARQEEAFRNALSRVASHALRGSELELLDAEGAPVMRLRPQASLRDVPWRVVRLDTTPNARRATLREPSGELTAVFDQGDLLTGETGRTTFFAFYEDAGGASLDIFDVRPSEPGCSRRSRSRECRLEVNYLDLLKAVDGYEVRTSDGRLVLLDGDRRVIELEPRDAGDGG